MVDEDLRIDLWTLRLYRDQLVAEDAPAGEWRRYREWRDAVITAADDHATVPAAV
jgi:hypothetical protein